MFTRLRHQLQNIFHISRSTTSRRKQTPERRWKTRHIRPLGSLSHVKQNRVLQLRVAHVKESQSESHNRPSRRSFLRPRRLLKPVNTAPRRLWKPERPATRTPPASTHSTTLRYTSPSFVAFEISSTNSTLRPSELPRALKYSASSAVRTSCSTVATGPRTRRESSASIASSTVFASAPLLSVASSITGWQRKNSSTQRDATS
jgi:hypothetical protein